MMVQTTRNLGSGYLETTRQMVWVSDDFLKFCRAFDAFYFKKSSNGKNIEKKIKRNLCSSCAESEHNMLFQNPKPGSITSFETTKVSKHVISLLLAQQPGNHITCGLLLGPPKALFISELSYIVCNQIHLWGFCF